MRLCAQLPLRQFQQQSCGLDLDDHGFVDDEIEPVGSQRNSLVPYPSAEFASDAVIPRLQLVLECARVDVLEEPESSWLYTS